MIFLCLEALPFKTNIKVRNNKAKPVLLSRIKDPNVRLFLNLLLKYVKYETLGLIEKLLLLKILSDPRYYERLTCIS